MNSRAAGLRKDVREFLRCRFRATSGTSCRLHNASFVNFMNSFLQGEKPAVKWWVQWPLVISPRHAQASLDFAKARRLVSAVAGLTESALQRQSASRPVNVTDRPATSREVGRDVGGDHDVSACRIHSAKKFRGLAGSNAAAFHLHSMASTTPRPAGSTKSISPVFTASSLALVRSDRREGVPRRCVPRGSRHLPDGGRSSRAHRRRSQCRIRRPCG